MKFWDDMISDTQSESAARRKRATGGGISSPKPAASHSPAAFIFMALVAFGTGFGLMWSFPG